jgi:hypothetical protein
LAQVVGRRVGPRAHGQRAGGGEPSAAPELGPIAREREALERHLGLVGAEHAARRLVDVSACVPAGSHHQR